ncbi:bifunctional tetrahydrofolate synthase/dihydrofolate synthase [Allopusillimonas soli]|uniref:Dihydrofolate synthase/folylpolyglutamate synthase n=1 Tax=Allopusillimonas soli TaxID=659016 RepID=A0A853FAN7_9BURK|nr:bifunctional tetrahydrofolate synthase/dihydrofolate synthase [Allopusillimonas soli]NYT36672.1 bifunctional tetrahydrofolate synthase/dihydrofolate synthase [Allopusillimonas soli]TEA75154.1 bifunctional tetrahydrofolate synthase/dihydrofolate synthase [Allopusillimonas soli]
MSLPVPSEAASLQDWLSYLESLHRVSIDLGLDRIRTVARRIGITLPCVKITVGGTNGKGSTCAMLEAILQAAGYKTGQYTSPHLISFNERIRVNGVNAGDASIIAQFQRIEAGRGDVTLSYFEYTTLAALMLFEQEAVDVAILEVGLGGRLDAVNLIDTDCAIVTSVDIDHAQYLGNTREKIGWEKAHIFRPGKPAICADPVPPSSIIDYAGEIGADLWLFGKDFNYSGDRQQWAYGGRAQRRNALAYPALRGANQLLNASAALAALEALRPKLAVPQQSVREGLAQVALPGRLQILPGTPVVVLDVAHNPHAAAALGQNLDNMGHFARTHAVIGMLSDKDIDGVIGKLASRVDHWYCASLEGPRATSGEALAGHVRSVLAARSALVAADGAQREQGAGSPSVQDETPPASSSPGVRAHAPAAVSADQATVSSFVNPVQAFTAAQGNASGNDRILVFGSFATVGPVLDALGRIDA